MMIIVVIIAIIAACCMSSSAAAVMIYFSWADVSKFLGFASPAPATPPSFDNTVTPPVPKTEGGPPPTPPPVPKTGTTPPVPKTGTPPPVPKSTTPPAQPVTNPGDFSLANTDYKPTGIFKDDVLGTINALRAIRNVSDPKPQNPAPPFKWDDNLAQGACTHAEINARGPNNLIHHPGVDRRGGWEIIAWDDPNMGGLFAMWNEHKFPANRAFPNVPSAWHCDPGNTACSITGKENGQEETGHYGFMAHTASTHIGCCTKPGVGWNPLVCQGR